MCRCLPWHPGMLPHIAKCKHWMRYEVCRILSGDRIDAHTSNHHGHPWLETWSSANLQDSFAICLIWMHQLSNCCHSKLVQHSHSVCKILYTSHLGTIVLTGYTTDRGWRTHALWITYPPCTLRLVCLCIKHCIRTIHYVLQETRVHIIGGWKQFVQELIHPCIPLTNQRDSMILIFIQS